MFVEHMILTLPLFAAYHDIDIDMFCDIYYLIQVGNKRRPLITEGASIAFNDMNVF